MRTVNKKSSKNGVIATIKIPKPKNRNPLVMTGRGKSQIMKDRRTPRGGDKNDQREYLEELEDSISDDEINKE